MGATNGAVLSKDKKKGAISAAIGAVVAETVAEHLPTAFQPGQGIDTALTRPTLPQHTEIAKLVATTVATVTNGDANIALRTADTAVRYNLLNHIPDQEGVDAATEIFEEELKYVNDTAHEGIEYAQEIIVSTSQLEDIMAGRDTITGLTWHHHQGIGRMQLIPRDVHKNVGHVGGMEMWFKSN